MSLENVAAERDAELAEARAEIERIGRQRDEVRAQLPSNEDAAALAAMAQLLSKAAPAIEKAKRSAGAPKMRIADGGDAIAEAA